MVYLSFECPNKLTTLFAAWSCMILILFVCLCLLKSDLSLRRIKRKERLIRSIVELVLVVD